MVRALRPYAVNTKNGQITENLPAAHDRSHPVAGVSEICSTN